MSYWATDLLLDRVFVKQAAYVKLGTPRVESHIIQCFAPPWVVRVVS
jgi:hypothetical protein